jgi:hypothetical protein
VKVLRTPGEDVQVNSIGSMGLRKEKTSQALEGRGVRLGSGLCGSDVGHLNWKPLMCKDHWVLPGWANLYSYVDDYRSTADAPTLDLVRARV